MSINNRIKKKTKKRSTDSRTTLDSQHNKMIIHLEKMKHNIPKKEKELHKLLKMKKKLMNSEDGFGCIYSENSKKIYVLNQNIKKLEKEIKNIKSNNIYTDYYSKTSHILYEYFENIKNVKNRHSENKVTNNIFDKYRKKVTYNKSKSRKKKKNKYSTMKISDYVNTKDKSNRADLLNSYTKIVNPSKYTPNQIRKKTKIDICKKCNIEMFLNNSQGHIVCPKCGREENILIDSDKPSYKDPPPDSGEFTYKRINRFDEWLTQYQAKETTEIPQYVIDSILLEIKKEGIKDLSNISMNKVRGYLKKIGLNKYYEHIPHIIYCLNGLPTPRLSQETEDKLRFMFRQIQDIFDTVCPSNRTNFLSYSYLLRKLLELLGEDEHKKYFRLHKSREKIYQHDKVWQKICKILNWQYIRTV